MGKTSQPKNKNKINNYIHVHTSPISNGFKKLPDDQKKKKTKKTDEVGAPFFKSFRFLLVKKISDSVCWETKTFGQMEFEEGRKGNT